MGRAIRCNNTSYALLVVLAVCGILLLPVYFLDKTAEVPSHHAGGRQPRNIDRAAQHERNMQSGPGGEAARLAMQERLTTSYTHKSLGSKATTLPIGYLKVPTLPPLPRAGEPGAREAAADDRRLHVIFSSGCNWAQHWESEFTLASAALAGQRGRVTRIVSGCHDTSGEGRAHRHQTFPAGKNDIIVKIPMLNRSVNAEFGLYVTPPFDGAVDFPWINKPSGIAYFMKHARPELDRMGETIVAVIDPDFIFLRPLTMVGKPADQMIVSRDTVDPFPGGNGKLDVPEKGRPVGQRYGIEGGWVGGRFDLDRILGPGSNKAKTYSTATAGKYFSVGPPMIAHTDDWAELAPAWEKYMRPVLDQEKDILADMWAYSMAAAEVILHRRRSDPACPLPHLCIQRPA